MRGQGRAGGGDGGSGRACLALTRMVDFVDPHGEAASLL
jgi:hypothetical protein